MHFLVSNQLDEGSQGQTKRAVVLEEEEEEPT